MIVFDTFLAGVVGGLFVLVCIQGVTLIHLARDIDRNNALFAQRIAVLERARLVAAMYAPPASREPLLKSEIDEMIREIEEKGRGIG